MRTITLSLFELLGFSFGRRVTLVGIRVLVELKDDVEWCAFKLEHLAKLVF